MEISPAGAAHALGELSDNADSTELLDFNVIRIFLQATQVRAVGLAPANRGLPGYWHRHDVDGNGIACETLPSDTPAANRHASNAADGVIVIREGKIVSQKN